MIDIKNRGDPYSIPLRDSCAINNELVQTETNSGHSEFVRVSFSSLSIHRHGIGAGSMSAELKPIVKRGIMKNILINPPQNTQYPQPPPGLGNLAAVLEEKGHQVEIIDANALQLSEREITEKVKGEEAICITVMTPAVNSAIKSKRII